MNWSMVGLGAVIALIVVMKSRKESRHNGDSSERDVPRARQRTRTAPVARVLDGGSHDVAEASRRFRAAPWTGEGTPPSESERQRSISAGFRPGTLALVQAMRWENDVRFVKARDETYLVSEIVVAIANYMYRKFGPDVSKGGPWQVPESIVKAARAALPDHGGTYAGEYLAHLLVKALATDDYVIAQLHPWERIAFTWRKQQLTGEKIAHSLRESGIFDSLSAAQIMRLDAWIAAPTTALNEMMGILRALFGDARLVESRLRDAGFENDHHGLFERLMKQASPPVEVESVEQSWGEPALADVSDVTDLMLTTESGERTFQVGEDPQLVDEGVRVFQHHATAEVRFTYAGRRYRFPVESNGTWMEVARVVRAADTFFLSLGRPDRVFRFQMPRGENGEWGVFITAPAPQFRGVAERLQLPLMKPE